MSSQSRPATQFKLRMPVSDLPAASNAAEILSSMSEPEALAVSTFEIRNHEDGQPDTAGWIVEAYFDAKPELNSISSILNGLVPRTSICAITIENVPDENWVALSQAALPPVRAGRFIIHGSHDRKMAGGQTLAIEIDAGEAFGTAHHETTKGCLLALDELARTREFSNVLDLGCGSAVLAIAAAKVLPGATILASDIDPQATTVAQKNITLNGQSARISVVTATGIGDDTLNRPNYFDLVLANILAAPLIELAGDLGKVVRPDGIAILSGLLNSQADEVIASYLTAGFNVTDHRRLQDWSTLTLRKI